MKLFIIKNLIFFSFYYFVQSQSITAISHRGASSIAPENTISAFKKAIDLNSDYFELDVRTTIDDSLIIMHDEFVNRTTNGTGKVQDLAFQQIRSFDAGSYFSPEFSGEKVPTLFESLKLAKEYNSKICIHVYVAKIKKLVNLIQNMGMQSKVIILSFEFSHLDSVKKIDSTISVCYLSDYATGNEASKMKSINGEYIGIGDTPKYGAINYAHSLGIKYFAWTIDDVSKMKTAISLKVDGIITNFPQFLIPIRDSLNLLSTEKIENNFPKKFQLYQNYPNPFNPITTISYTIPKASNVKLRIFDILGLEVETLVDSFQNSGFHEIKFNASRLTSKIYFYKIVTDEFTTTKKMLLIK